MIKREMPHLGAAINEESYAWMVDNFPVIAAAVYQEVKNGATPEEIRQFVLRQTHREKLADRSQQAAAFLVAQQD